MKTTFLLFAIFISNLLSAQSSWKPLGSNGGLVSDTSSPRSTVPSIATDTAGNPYIAYRDISNNNTLVIKKFNGTNWMPIGNLGNHLRGGNPSIVVSPNDTVYVAYFDGNLQTINQWYFSVIKFDGINWVPVGSAIMAQPGNYSGTYIAVDSNEKLYMGYGASSSNPGKADILTFDGTAWIPVGNTDFVQYSSGMSLRIGLNNELYLGYNNSYSPFSSIDTGWVRKWDGVQWDTVGQPLLGGVGNIDIAQDGSLYCVGRLVTGGFPVYKLVNNAWTQWGGATGAYTAPRLKVDKQGTPHISFSEANGSGSQVSVKRYNGTSWNYLGVKAFTNAVGGVSYLSMVLGKNNQPYVSYQTNATTNEKIYAWYYDSVLVNTVAADFKKTDFSQLYPNPAYSGEPITLMLSSLEEGDYRITIYNISGHLIYKEPYRHKGGKAAIPITPKLLPSGNYYLKIDNANHNYTSMFIIR